MTAEAQTAPETGEDDADRRAKETFTDYRDLLATCKKHNLRVEAGDDWEHPFIKCVAKALRSAVEAEREACADLVENHTLYLSVDFTTDAMAAAIRARGAGS